MMNSVAAKVEEIITATTKNAGTEQRSLPNPKTPKGMQEVKMTTLATLIARHAVNRTPASIPTANAMEYAIT